MKNLFEIVAEIKIKGLLPNLEDVLDFAFEKATENVYLASFIFDQAVKGEHFDDAKEALEKIINLQNSLKEMTSLYCDYKSPTEHDVIIEIGLQNLEKSRAKLMLHEMALYEKTDISINGIIKTFDHDIKRLNSLINNSASSPAKALKT